MNNDAVAAHPIGSLGVGVTLQRCPLLMHRARVLYHQLPHWPVPTVESWGSQFPLAKGIAKQVLSQGPSAGENRLPNPSNTHSLHHHLLSWDPTVYGEARSGTLICKNVLLKTFCWKESTKNKLDLLSLKGNRVWVRLRKARPLTLSLLSAPSTPP